MKSVIYRKGFYLRKSEAKPCCCPLRQTYLDEDEDAGDEDEGHVEAQQLQQR